MTEAPPPLPITVPPPVETMRLPKRLYILVVLGIMFGAAAATAAVIGARVTYDSGVAEQEDVLRNREYLHATCENTRAVTEQFTTKSPAPCPTDFP